MSQIEPVFNGPRYTIVAWARDQKTILYHEFGSYQGEWMLLAKGADEYLVYKGSYGSCSGCDAFEAELGYSNITREAAEKFAKDYPSFIEVPFSTMRNLVTNGTMAKLFPANVRDTYSEISYDEFASDAQIAVKVEENIDVTAADILNCKNQEIKQTALKRFGYENFVRDANMDEIDRDGENALLRTGDIVFAYVKDSSTPRRYLLRVPPNMRKVRDAIAWTFGMSPSEYAPLIET